ncbi:MAG: type II toxin-antitoxin system VapC family toxin [Bacteroidetes bacterium]|nr:type II toxin-antitoxin system VapC family toxin [Bacteroidota bacterium]
MNQYLLDTDICIFFLQGKFGIKEKVLEVGIENCYISEITLLELMYGAEKSKRPEKHTSEVFKMEALFEVVPIYNSFPIYAKERVRLQKEGRLIPDFDLLIGATAVAHNLIMVTNNVKHLERIQEIVIENWRTKEHNQFAEI